MDFTEAIQAMMDGRKVFRQKYIDMGYKGHLQIEPFPITDESLLLIYDTPDHWFSGCHLTAEDLSAEDWTEVTS